MTKPVEVPVHVDPKPLSPAQSKLKRASSPNSSTSLAASRRT
jgi:hypothetical protein